MPIVLRGPRKAMRGKCERGHESANADGRVRKSFGGMPKSSWAPPKAMRGKCERRGGNINADAANAEVFAGGGCSQGASFVPMAAISRRWRGGRNIIIRVRASGCGESALNPPTSPPIPRRRSAPAPAERHALPEHFLTPSPCPPATSPQPRRTPADLTTHSPPKTFALPEHFLTPFPRSSAPPRSTDAHPQAAPCIPRRRPSLAPSVPLRTQKTAPHSGCAMHSPPTSQHIPRRKPAPTPAQRRALPLPSCHIPAPMHAPSRRRRTFPAEDLRPSPQRRPASPSVPLRAQKNGTAQCMCDAECLGRPSLRSVIWVGEPRAVRRRCGALACRRGA